MDLRLLTEAETRRGSGPIGIRMQRFLRGVASFHKFNENTTESEWENAIGEKNLFEAKRLGVLLEMDYEGGYDAGPDAEMPMEEEEEPMSTYADPRMSMEDPGMEADAAGADAEGIDLYSDPEGEAGAGADLYDDAEGDDMNFDVADDEDLDMGDGDVDGLDPEEGEVASVEDRAQDMADELEADPELADALDTIRAEGGGDLDTDTGDVEELAPDDTGSADLDAADADLDMAPASEEPSDEVLDSDIPGSEEVQADDSGLNASQNARKRHGTGLSHQYRQQNY